MINMVRMMKTGLVKTLEYALMVLMAVLVLDVLWGIVSQAFWLSPWTNELATMLLIWVALLGASVAFARNSHLGVDFFVEKLGPGPKAFAAVLVQLTVVFFAVVILIYGGTRVVKFILENGQASPALQIQVGYVYLALPISGCLVLLVALEQVLVSLSGSDRETEQGEA